MANRVDRVRQRPTDPPAGRGSKLSVGGVGKRTVSEAPPANAWARPLSKAVVGKGTMSWAKLAAGGAAPPPTRAPSSPTVAHSSQPYDRNQSLGWERDAVSQAPSIVNEAQTSWGALPASESHRPYGGHSSGPSTLGYADDNRGDVPYGALPVHQQRNGFRAPGQGYDESFNRDPQVSPWQQPQAPQTHYAQQNHLFDGQQHQIDSSLSNLVVGGSMEADVSRGFSDGPVTGYNGLPGHGNPNMHSLGVGLSGVRINDGVDTRQSGVIHNDNSVGTASEGNGLGLINGFSEGLFGGGFNANSVSGFGGGLPGFGGLGGDLGSTFGGSGGFGAGFGGAMSSIATSAHQTDSPSPGGFLGTTEGQIASEACSSTENSAGLSGKLGGGVSQAFGTVNSSINEGLSGGTWGLPVSPSPWGAPSAHSTELWPGMSAPALPSLSSLPGIGLGASPWSEGSSGLTGAIVGSGDDALSLGGFGLQSWPSSSMRSTDNGVFQGQPSASTGFGAPNDPGLGHAPPGLHVPSQMLGGWAPGGLSPSEASSASDLASGHMGRESFLSAAVGDPLNQGGQSGPPLELQSEIVQPSVGKEVDVAARAPSVPSTIAGGSSSRTRKKGKKGNKSKGNSRHTDGDDVHDNGGGSTDNQTGSKSRAEARARAAEAKAQAQLEANAAAEAREAERLAELKRESEERLKEEREKQLAKEKEERAAASQRAAAIRERHREEKERKAAANRERQRLEEQERERKRAEKAARAEARAQKERDQRERKALEKRQREEREEARKQAVRAEAEERKRIAAEAALAREQAQADAARLAVDGTEKKVKRSCSYCGNGPSEGNKLLRCSYCKKASYCSRKCQGMAWKESHKAECNPPQK